MHVLATNKASSTSSEEKKHQILCKITENTQLIKRVKAENIFSHTHTQIHRDYFYVVLGSKVTFRRVMITSLLTGIKMFDWSHFQPRKSIKNKAHGTGV
jgi:hypothetical protein